MPAPINLDFSANLPRGTQMRQNMGNRITIRFCSYIRRSTSASAGTSTFASLVAHLHRALALGIALSKHLIECCRLEQRAHRRCCARQAACPACPQAPFYCPCCPKPHDTHGLPLANAVQPPNCLLLQ